MMAPHLIWAGVVLVLGVLAVRAVRLRWRSLDALGAQVERLGRGQAEAANWAVDLRASIAATSRVAEDAAQRIAALERKLAELEPIVKQLASVPKAQPLGRRV